VAEEVEPAPARPAKKLVIAVMGCAVNGPGEGARSPISAWPAGQGEGLLFRKGEVVAQGASTSGRRAGGGGAEARGRQQLAITLTAARAPVAIPPEFG